MRILFVYKNVIFVRLLKIVRSTCTVNCFDFMEEVYFCNNRTLTHIDCISQFPGNKIPISVCIPSFSTLLCRSHYIIFSGPDCMDCDWEIGGTFVNKNLYTDIKRDSQAHPSLIGQGPTNHNRECPPSHLYRGFNFSFNLSLLGHNRERDGRKWGRKKKGEEERTVEWGIERERER